MGEELHYSEEQRKNQEVARRINRETIDNPDSPYAGKVIGVWHQQVVAVADTLDDADAQLKAVGADPEDLLDQQDRGMWGGLGSPGVHVHGPVRATHHLVSS